MKKVVAKDIRGQFWFIHLSINATSLSVLLESINFVTSSDQFSGRLIPVSFNDSIVAATPLDHEKKKKKEKFIFIVTWTQQIKKKFGSATRECTVNGKVEMENTQHRIKYEKKSWKEKIKKLTGMSNRNGLSTRKITKRLYISNTAIDLFTISMSLWCTRQPVRAFCSSS